MTEHDDTRPLTAAAARVAIARRYTVNLDGAVQIKRAIPSSSIVVALLPRAHKHEVIVALGVSLTLFGELAIRVYIDRAGDDYAVTGWKATTPALHEQMQEVMR